MTERTNRRDEIVSAAACLFMQHGYAATSVRQIAEEVGVTEAALYYHFKEGKRALLQAVVETHVPDLLTAVEASRGAGSLSELVNRFGAALLHFGQQKAPLLRWVISEFKNFTPEERALFQERQLAMQRGLRAQVARFVPDEEEADRLAWLLIFVVFGYGNLFLLQQLSDVVAVDPHALIAALAAALGAHVSAAPASTEDP